MSNRKVAIVGAGACGLYLARKLAEKKNEVAVFEKRGLIGKETCSGLFSQRILNFVPESKSLIENQIDYCLIHFPKKTLKISFGKKFFVMSHAKLDNLLAGMAERAGAKIMLNSPIRSLPQDYDSIIGTDGPDSFTRKHLNLPEPDFYLAIQGFVSEKDSSNFVETWPTESGFLWRIPRRQEVEYGIFEKPAKATKIFEKYLKGKGLALERKSAALIPQGLIIPENKKITLCGDSAGMTKPWSGGGVIWGMLAGDILLKNFPDFIKYRIEAKRFFLPKIAVSKLAKKTAYFLGYNFPWIIPKNIKIEGDFLS